MNTTFVLCESAQLPVGLGGNDPRVVRIAAHGSGANLKLESLGPRIYENLEPLAYDLVHLAAYVYVADRLVSRGGKDVYGERWRRQFHFVVPVRNRSVWESAQIRKLLVEALTFLSEDFFTFTFVDAEQSDESREQTYLQLGDYDSTTSVALFSGGLDSLAGAVWDHVQNGERSVLVSHRSAPIISKRQKDLVTILRDRIPGFGSCHAPAWIHLDGERDREYSQRTRSFLYLSLAGAVAATLGKPRIKVYENGIVSLNVPILGQTVGARLTRTTHPKFLNLFRQLLSALFQRTFAIDTPFMFLTKGEVAAKLAEVGHADLIEASTSCSHTYLSTSAEPHCGICSQCIDRRLAIMAMDLEPYDHVYQHDMFRDSFSSMPEVALPKAMVEGYIRAYLNVAKIPLGEFYQRYPEIGTAVLAIGGNLEETYNSIYDLYLRRAAEVNKAVVKAIQASAQELFSGGLPDDCLLRVLGSGEHLREPIARLADALGAVLDKGLPVAFQNREPESEQEVQDAVEALFIAADKELSRELPMVDFLHIKGAKPDFSTTAERLFVEVKYPRKTRKAAAIGEEIAADIAIYEEHAASVLFVVYDPQRLVKNPEQFLARLTARRGVYGQVIH